MRAAAGRLVALAGLAATAAYGRLVRGERFEHHVAAELGVSPVLAAELVGHLRARVGAQKYVALAAPFAAVTRAPLRAALPYRVRRRASRPFLTELLADLAAVLTFLGAASSRDEAPCGGLVAV